MVDVNNTSPLADLFSIYGGTIGNILIVFLLVFIFIVIPILTFLIPWFIWRTKVYSKKSYRELQLLRRWFASAKASQATADALQDLADDN